MQNALAAQHSFTANFGEHTARLSALLVDGEPWFRAKEAAAAMGHKNPQKAVRQHVCDEDKVTLEDLGVTETVTLTNPNEGACTYISESGLYSLIWGSKLPLAQAFKRWVMKEVLPCIRRTGSYRAPRAPAGDSALRDGEVRESEAIFLRMAGAKLAYELAKSVGSDSAERVRKEGLRLVDEFLLPRGTTLDDYDDASDILRDRGYNEAHVARLAGALGTALKEQANAEERPTRTYACGVGPEEIGREKQIRLYHRSQDREFVERVLATFKEKPLHARVLAGAADPVAARKNRARANRERERVLVAQAATP